MSISNRITTLESRHWEIEGKIRDAYLTHQDNERITSLKKEKLLIKEKIDQLTNNQ